MRKFPLTIVTKAQEDLGVEFTAIAATEDVDRLKERIVINGGDFSNYLRNPILLFNHDPNKPVGKVTQISTEDGKLTVRFTFASTPLAQEVKTLVSEGVLNTLSIGFISRKGRFTENGIYEHVDWELVEVSVVSVPANPAAVITMRGIVPDNDAEFDIYPDPKREWDADASEKRWRKFVGIETHEDLQDKEKQKLYAKRFFWVDDERPDLFGSYKLPHVDVIDGKPYAIWRGITAAMAALAGARGGVDIPDEDRRKVYRAIVKYYKKAKDMGITETDPPEFDELGKMMDAVREFVETVKKALA